jgi:hypothetical protein
MIESEILASRDERIDRINLLELRRADQPPEGVLYLCIIQDAVISYLYSFLSKNEANADAFYSAWRYFFETTSTNPATWNANRAIRHSSACRGDESITHYLVNSEMELMCFDRHYDMSGLSEYMHISKFREKLKAKRRKIVTNGWPKIESFINNTYQRELSQIVDGQQVPFRVWSDSIQELLVDPIDPRCLAGAMYIPSKLKKTKKHHSRKVKKAAKYIHREMTIPGIDWVSATQLGGS